MELRFRTLTPIHVGDGSSLHSFDYVIHNGHFYRTSRRFFENFLKYMHEEKGVNLYDRFVEWSGDLTERISNVEDERRRNPRNRDFNQTLADLRRQFSLHEFAKKTGQERPFLDYLQQQKTPSLRVFSEDKRLLEIRGFQRDADERVYLPGSSIKGCIRTALLYHFLERHADHAEVRKLLENSLLKLRTEKHASDKGKFNLERHRKQFAEELENLAFRAGMIGERGGDPKFTEAQDDLLKCLLVGDVSVPADGVGIEKIDLYLVKKLPKGAGYEAQRQRQAPAVEAIQPGQYLEIRLDINIDLLLALHKKSKENERGIKVGHETHWIGWRDKAKTAFGLSADDLDKAPEKPKKDDPEVKRLREKALAHILACCRTFSDAQADALAHWQRDEFCLPKHHAGPMARDLENGTVSVYGARGTRLHLGFATGFEGMTVVLHLLAQHKKVFTEIMDTFGIGDSPSAWKNRRPGEAYHANPDKFPKSRRFATRPGEILPLGWMEWADDPEARNSAAPQTTSAAHKQGPGTPAATLAPAGPAFLKGTLKPGAELDAELVHAGNPGRFKLFIREDYQPEIDVRYAAGFKQEDIGRLARIRVKNIKGKEEVTVVEFIRFK